MPQLAKRTEDLPIALHDFIGWLKAAGEFEAADEAYRVGKASALGIEVVLPGPVGERNVYALRPRGCILISPETKTWLYAQIAAVLATGNSGRLIDMALPDGLPRSVAAAFGAGDQVPIVAALVEGGPARISAMVEAVAASKGSIVSVHAADPALTVSYQLHLLLEEVSISTNTTAAGGNANLMMIG